MNLTKLIHIHHLSDFYETSETNPFEQNREDPELPKDDQKVNAKLILFRYSHDI